MSQTPPTNPQEGFLTLPLAAMHDALREGKLTQLQTQLDPDGKGMGRVRIIVIPEKLQYNWPSHFPFGTQIKGN